uniref:Uncharacterized protein n=1 Tax=Anguilla anguilla TaxID=7936 RepID=A0A0E9WHT7_ANGAN
MAYDMFLRIFSFDSLQLPHHAFGHCLGGPPYLR